MLKRLLIGLVAVVLVTIFVAESANAIAIRLRRSVENFHQCGSVELCNGALEVKDTLYGWDGIKAICTMTGRVFCIPTNNGYICSDSDSEPVLSTASFSDTATFDVETASDLTVLDQQAGQNVCDDEYGDETTTFDKFWPNVFLAHSFYTGDNFPNLPEGTTTYELFEVCTIQTDDPQYECVKLWDSSGNFSVEDRPKLPCCGETNTLTVDVERGGTVTSDDGKINCGTNGTDCKAVYDGTVAPYDGCPEVTLTATADVGLSGYYFTGWSGGDCTGTDPCTITPKDSPTVTATFEASYHTLTVIVRGDGDKDKVWIKDPRSDFDVPAEFYCTDECTKQFDPDTVVVVKRKGGTWDSWGGVCSGVPNSVDTCEIKMDSSKTAVANFINE